ncbi:MAG: phytanoyl-CoA dioxygenase family protein, partial [Phycisphaeraceae bacterium]|nr:phytanoyl-CoA dioxygenase family protein [Phycisphaeraceae bacterium]
SVTQVADFQHEGYLLPRTPVLPHEKFVGLKNYLEELLAALPSHIRPETMDVPHFSHPELFQWLFADEVLDLVEPIIGPDIALFSSHFICKPTGNGKRVPWHEDSAYWKTMLDPMEVVTIWLAIDPSTPLNGCMNVIPRTHTGPKKGFSDYEPVDPAKNVFTTEITPAQRKDGIAVPCELQPNEASLHDGRLMHGSPPNASDIRRCGYTMRFMPTTVKFNQAQYGDSHQVYLARGRDRAGNQYADPTRSYPELARYRETLGKGGH